MEKQIEVSVGDEFYTVVITHYEPIMPGRFDGPPEYCYPDEGGISEWHLLNDDGLQDDDLMDNLSEDAKYIIDQAVIDYMEREIEESKYD